jgi:NADH:ubiquinone oxidoreductase subunit E
MAISATQIPLNDPLIIPEKKALIDHILEENRSKPGSTMVVLNQLQSQIGFISEPMQKYVADKLRVPTSTIHGVVSFY